MSKRDERLIDGDLIDFGALPEEVSAVLQRGVAAYRYDRCEADRLFRQALARAPEALPVYFCLYKIHAYQGNSELALEAARAGLAVATRQAGWSSDWRRWPEDGEKSGGAERFALYTLKALAFIHLRRNEREQAMSILARLAVLDPCARVGWHVVKALADASA